MMEKWAILETISEAICVSDKVEFKLKDDENAGLGDRLLEVLNELKEMWNIEEE